MSSAPASPRTTAVKTVADIRADFPALHRRHHGQPVAYFDGPGGTQVPSAVIEAMSGYLASHNANTHWAYPTSEETDRIIGLAREAMARLLNASADEIAFGPNMTTLTFHLSRALGRRLAPGDTIVVTELDHHANSDTWRELAADRGLRIRLVPFDPATGTLVWTELEQAIAEGPRLVAIGGASNALGTINDIRTAVQLARAAGALTFIDAVHYAPHVLVDVADLGCDFLACSPYKFYGPHLGVLFGKRDVLASLDAPRLEPASNAPAEKFETGTQSHEAIAGAAATVGWLESLAPGLDGRAALRATYDTLHARHMALVRRLWAGLSAIDGVRLYGVPPTAPRTPTVAFTVAGHDAESVARALTHDGLFLSHGDFYALTVVRRLGLERDGLVRAGCACYTNDEDVERLIAAVARIATTR